MKANKWEAFLVFQDSTYCIRRSQNLKLVEEFMKNLREMEQNGNKHVIQRLPFHELSWKRFKYTQNKGPTERLHYEYEFWMEWKKS